ncbi:MAG: helix-turn-helix domain-containing protein [Oscillospiraceae bacterium]|nr:helix-turn-helix domain-containing protein [Oscillospiraceae bacterium]
MEIGTLIKNARNESKLTQEQTAESLGVSRQTISNWENGKSYPDIISVIKMSDLYSVSLDYLLKEETSMKQTYKEYLEESTNAVKSCEKKSKLILILVTLGIWALSVAAFWLIEQGLGETGYSTAIVWGALPVTFFVVSAIIGQRNYFGRLKWLTLPCFGAMYALTGTVTEIHANNAFYRAVVWPDLTKLPIALAIALAGLCLGIFSRNKIRSAKKAA